MNLHHVETVKEGMGTRIQRMRVEGGWLTGEGPSTTFVPETEEEIK